MMCVIHATAHLHIAHVSNCLAKSGWVGWLVVSLELRDRTVGPLFICAMLSWPGMLAVD